MHGRLLTLFVAIGCSCGGSDGGGVFGSDVEGTVEADIPQFKAKWQMTPTACYSGERSGFFGVDLIEDDDQDTLVRIASDPIEGYRVATNVPGTDKSVHVAAEDGCQTFDIDVVRTNTRINNIWDVEGHAVVDCELPGLSLHIDLNYAGCH
jgi:HSP20 family molecular chaperone IbpA